MQCHTITDLPPYGWIIHLAYMPSFCDKNMPHAKNIWSSANIYHVLKFIIEDAPVDLSQILIIHDGNFLHGIISPWDTFLYKRAVPCFNKLIGSRKLAWWHHNRKSISWMVIYLITPTMFVWQIDQVNCCWATNHQLGTCMVLHFSCFYYIHGRVCYNFNAFCV